MSLIYAGYTELQRAIHDGNLDGFHSHLGQVRDRSSDGIGFGETALHVAASATIDESIRKTMMKTLVHQGAELDVPNGHISQLTPLGSAVCKGKIEAAVTLIQLGANPNTGTELKTSLYLAAERGDAAMVRTLLENGANPFKTSYMNYHRRDRLLPLDAARSEIGRVGNEEKKNNFEEIITLLTPDKNGNILLAPNARAEAAASESSTGEEV